MKKIILFFLAFLAFSLIITGCSGKLSKNEKPSLNFTLAWNNMVYEITDETVPIENLGKQIGEVERNVSPKIEKNGDSSSRLPEGPMGAYAGSKLYEILNTDEREAIAVENGKNKLYKCVYNSDLE